MTSCVKAYPRAIITAISLVIEVKIVKLECNIERTFNLNRLVECYRLSYRRIISGTSKCVDKLVCLCCHNIGCVRSAVVVGIDNNTIGLLLVVRCTVASVVDKQAVHICHNRQ